MRSKEEIEKYKQQVISDFDRRTDYDRATFPPLIADRLIKLAELQSGWEVLDIATGTGLVAIASAKIVGNSGKVVGIDISTGMLERARKKATELKNLEFQLADAEFINFSDNSFDAILSASGIAYLTDIPAALKQWYRFLKPGGLVVFSCAAETAFPPALLFRDILQKYGISIPNPNETLGTPEKCEKLLREVGFKDIEVQTEQLGWYYVDIGSVQALWNVYLKSGFGFQALQLPPEKLAQCKADYFTSIEALETEKGIWNDVTTFFVLGRK